MRICIAPCLHLSHVWLNPPIASKYIDISRIFPVRWKRQTAKFLKDRKYTVTYLGRRWSWGSQEKFLGWWTSILFVFMTEITAPLGCWFFRGFPPGWNLYSELSGVSMSQSSNLRLGWWWVTHQGTHPKEVEEHEAIWPKMRAKGNMMTVSCQSCSTEWRGRSFGGEVQILLEEKVTNSSRYVRRGQSVRRSI